MAIKKRIAALGAAMVMGLSMMSMGASAETANWSARCVRAKGAPSTESTTGYASLTASRDTYTGKVKSMSNITNRKLTLSCKTHTMSTGSIVYNNTGSRKWKISGIISNKKDKVTYKMVAYTSLNGTTLYVSGTVSR